MSRRTAPAVAAALAAAFAAPAFALPLAPQGRGGSLPPALRIVSNAPLEVAGSRFRPAERVTLTVRAVGKARTVVRASRRGAFVARFPLVTTDRCVGTVVIARGGSGSVAALRVVPFACPPPGRASG